MVMDVLSIQYLADFFIFVGKPHEHYACIKYLLTYAYMYTFTMHRWIMEETSPSSFDKSIILENLLTVAWVQAINQGFNA